MEFKTRPWYVINRWWERIVADIDGIINTNNQEAIEVLSILFPNVVKEETSEEVKEDLAPKKEEWKSKTKK